MAITSDPAFKVTVTGTSISAYENTNTYDLEDKLEMSFSIQGTVGTPDPVESADYVIPIDTVRHTRTILIHASNECNVKFTTAVGEFIVPIVGDFLLTTTQDFMDDLTSLHVSTFITTPVTVYVNIYGRVPPAT